jgi:hypothetical protein
LTKSHKKAIFGPSAISFTANLKKSGQEGVEGEFRVRHGIIRQPFSASKPIARHDATADAINPIASDDLWRVGTIHCAGGRKEPAA